MTDAPREGRTVKLPVHRRVLVRVAVALVSGGVLLVPDAAGARPMQESDPGGGGEASGQSSATVDVDIDVQKASSADVQQAFADIRDNFEAQRAALETARQAVTAAENEVALAQAKVDETQAEIDAMVGESDAVVVRTFMNPPSESAIQTLTATSPSDATVKRALLDMYADADAGVIAQFQAKQEELRVEKAAQEEATEQADIRRAEADAALADLRAAATQQVQFAADIEARLERNLSEADALQNIDPELAAQLREEQAALAQAIADAQAQIAAEDALEDAGVEPADPDAPTGPSTIVIEGGLANVSCPSGGSITVAGVLARDLQGLLNLASQQGVPLCGNGWRDINDQIALRRAHCGTSNYAIYQAPSSACSPPTARPGASEHEKGLAVDFTCGGGGTVSNGDSCDSFLENNAADFGMYNLPSEPWHYSTTGT
jgi:peptidoglycan hydrolase CwlO-like protein